MTTDERLGKWRQDIVVALFEVQHLSNGHEVFATVGEIIKDQLAIRQSAFAFYLGLAYLDWSAMAARRFVDTRQDAHSLWRLLDEISRHPADISRKYFQRAFLEMVPHALFAQIVRPTVPLTVEGIEREANFRFDELAGTGVSCLLKQTVLADVDRLRSAAEIFERYASNFVAHRSKSARLMRSPADLADLGDAVVLFPDPGKLSEFIEAARSVFSRYHSLILGAPPLFGSVPADWKNVFRFPWIEKNNP
ncbi:MAG: hypothetical protein WA005_18130 [Candidatus Binataceae bacterium]